MKEEGPTACENQVFHQDFDIDKMTALGQMRDANGTAVLMPVIACIGDHCMC